MPNEKVFSLDKHIGFFLEDKETPFSTVKIVTSNEKTIFNVYIKNISDLLLNNIELAAPPGITEVNIVIPKELKPNEGFYAEFEANTELDSDKFIQVQAKPHSVVFE